MLGFLSTMKVYLHRDSKVGTGSELGRGLKEWYKPRIDRRATVPIGV